MISFEKVKVGLVLDALEDSHRKKGGVPWSKHSMGWNHELWISFDSNKRGIYLILYELWGKKVKRIFISDGAQGRDW